VTDPCVTATITDPTLTSISLKNGSVTTRTFADPLDSVDAGNVVKGLCGDRDFGIYDGNSGTPTAITWVTVTKDTPTPDTHTITVSPNNIALVTGSAISLYLRTTYTSYPSHAPKYTLM